MADYQETTLATLRARIQDKRDSVFWASAEVNWAIEEALRVWAVLTQHLRTTTTLAPGDNVTFYEGHSALSALYWLIMRIDQAGYTLDAETLDALDESDPDWQNATASTTPDKWVPLGLTEFALSPPNSGAGTTYNITVATAHHTGALGDGDFIQLGEEDISAIIDYVHYILLIKEGGQELSTAQALIERFMARASRYNSRVKRFTTYRTVAAQAPPLRK